MTREIKFRAWVIAKNCYTEVVSIEFSTNKVILKRTWNKANNAPMMKAVPLDKVILEQYTGLKDKNGKEIYEGDILREEGLLAITRVVWDEHYARYFTETINQKNTIQSYFYLDGISALHSEVIGNIHENPELLKEASCQS